MIPDPLSDGFFRVEALGETITINPPCTMVIQSASGGTWIHHVDADGKPAGGIYNGRPYADISELFIK